MKRLIFLLAFVPAFFCNWGCGSSQHPVKVISNTPVQEVGGDVSLPSTTKYVLRLNPSLLETGVRVDRVEMELSYKDKDDVDILYMKPATTDGKSFVAEAPRRSVAKFSVWLNPNKNPEGGSYCGPVQLYTDGFAGNQTGQLHEEEVLVITILSDMSQPQYCIYRRLSYADW